jgi:hypothetical protein
MKTKEEIVQEIETLEILLFEANAWVKRSMDKVTKAYNLESEEDDLGELEAALEGQLKLQSKIDALSWVIN